jgi:hypothetical protein
LQAALQYGFAGQPTYQGVRREAFTPEMRRL